MHRLLVIPCLCADVIQTLFRTLQLYGATLSLDTGRIRVGTRDLRRTYRRTHYHLRRRPIPPPQLPMRTGWRWIHHRGTKGGRAANDWRDPQRLSRLEDYVPAFFRRRTGVCRTYLRRIST